MKEIYEKNKLPVIGSATGLILGAIILDFGLILTSASALGGWVLGKKLEKSNKN